MLSCQASALALALAFAFAFAFALEAVETEYSQRDVKDLKGRLIRRNILAPMG